MIPTVQEGEEEEEEEEGYSGIWHIIDSDIESEGSEVHKGSVLNEEDEEDDIPNVQGPVERPKNYHDPGTRLQALTLYEAGLPFHQILALTRIGQRTVQSLKQRAVARGYDPSICKDLLLSYVEDAPRSGRPPIAESVKSMIIRVVTQNSTTRQYSTNRITAEVCELLGKEKAVSLRTCYRVLEAEGYSSCKQTVKPSLTDQMDRLA